MRFVSIVALATLSAFALATLPAEAQTERQRPRITVKKKRSYLDAGTTVKPGALRYRDYAEPIWSRYPSYGPDPLGSRWPLPGPFDGLPGNY
jgi:hypothetical protein